MTRIHSLLLSIAVGIAVLAGTYAVTRTTQLGAATAVQPHVSAAAVARRTRVLDRAEAALHAQLRRRPPALPSLPARTTSGASPSPALAAPATRPAVVYVRPKPIVHVIHRRGGESDDGGGTERDD